MLVAVPLGESSTDRGRVARATHLICYPPRAGFRSTAFSGGELEACEPVGPIGKQTSGPCPLIAPQRYGLTNVNQGGHPRL